MSTRHPLRLDIGTGTATGATDAAPPRRFSRTTHAIVILFFLGTAILSAEEAAIVIPQGITVRTGFGIGSQSLGFDISEADLSANSIELSPNVPLHWIIGAEWRRVGLAARVKMPATVADFETRGQTEFTNLQLQFFGDRNAVEINAQQHTGMYISNASDFDEEITDERIGDLRLTTLGLSFYRALNPRHSLAAAYKLNAWNERTTGSVIVLASYSLIGIEAPGGPAKTIPDADDTIWSDNLFILTQTLSAGAGYTALITWRDFFVSPLLAIALGSQWAEYAVGPEEDSGSSIAPSVHARLSAGFNGPRWIVALVGSIDLRSVQTPYLTASQGSQLIEIVVGRRFDLKRWRGTQDIEY